MHEFFLKQMKVKQGLLGSMANQLLPSLSPRLSDHYDVPGRSLCLFNSLSTFYDGTAKLVRCDIPADLCRSTSGSIARAMLEFLCSYACPLLMKRCSHALSVKEYDGGTRSSAQARHRWHMQWLN